MSTPPAEIETQRLLLRRPVLRDAEAIYGAYAADPDVTRFLTWRPHNALEETRRFLQHCQTVWGSGASRPYVIAQRTAPTHAIGMIEWRRDNDFAVSFGYVLAPAWWSRGYMAEALSTLVDWSLTQPDIHRASAFCDVDNPASGRVMEKAGMVFEGVLRRYSIHPTLSDEPRDCRLYAAVRGDVSRTGRD